MSNKTFDPLMDAPLHKDVVAEMQALAFALFDMLEQERSGVRDGDGTWHGSDPVEGTIERLRDRLPALDDWRRHHP